MSPLEMIYHNLDRTQPLSNSLLDLVSSTGFTPHFSEFVQNSGIKDIKPSDQVKAALHHFRTRKEFGDHAVIDNLLKDYSQKNYGYNPRTKAVRSMLGGRDYARRLDPKDAKIMKDQATMYQFVQGLKGLNFEGETLDTFYNKLGIDQAVNEKIEPPPKDRMDYEVADDLFHEFRERYYK